MQILIENYTPQVANLFEQKVGGDLFLNGIMMQSQVTNGNGRKYRLDELTKEVNSIQQRISEGHYICGELNHPSDLTINLANVSHAIVEARMDGNNAIGKMKLLNTPSGNIAKGLIEGGIRLGVSSRGTGNVNEGGDVTAFAFVTLDIVATPSAPDAYPNVVREALENKKILTLAEAVVHDPKAQAYFKKEIALLLSRITR